MKRIQKATVAIVAAGALTLGAAGIAGPFSSNPAAAASVSSSAASAYYKQALQTLNSFYKPALQGQFPRLEGLTLGESTREDVIKAIGEPETPARASGAFDVYHAEMGNPGYAISYKQNKIQEMRYFGTNVERQANIGGITVKMLVQQWGAPHSSTVFKNGSVNQKKIVYIRGAYRLEFIFNNSTDLDHINLVKNDAAASSDYYKQALQTLNSFYKPALQGQFPRLEGLTLGKSTREDVIKAIGEPETPAKASGAFDVYHAEMGNPGYAISYKQNKIREMRYFGTNVERQANIGGITVKMLVQQWGAPHSSTVFKNGSVNQKKIVYIRGAYQLEFIFNSSTDLDHINLVSKA
ncbi:YjgB family protein [Cohnella sp. 56]|uniref:YjgB family protein n=1 Tax=Cohnella sp. 56 TaxID=3113722 RepID=UPI0030E7A655